MTRHFCTLLDQNYLWKGLALHASLLRHGGDFVLHILCIDEVAHDLLTRLALPRVALIRLAEFEDDELRRVKPTRSVGEYYWTCTSSLPLFVFARHAGAQDVTYLDADLYFFSDPAPVFAAIGGASIAIHAHDFPERLAHLARDAGDFNVGWVGFRRDEIGLTCLREWRAQCIDWCFTRVEPGHKIGDQGYLDAWPARYGQSLHIMQHPGAGLGPWNIERHAITRRPDGVVLSDGLPVVFFHFHGFYLHEAAVTLAPVVYRLAPSVRELLYAPYEQALAAARRQVAAIEPSFSSGLSPRPGWPTRASQWLRGAGRTLLGG